MLKSTIAAVALLAILTTYFMISPLPIVNNRREAASELLLGRKHSALASAVTTMKKEISASRNPASNEAAVVEQAIFEKVALADSKANQAIDLQLPCVARGVFPANVTQVRLIGKACSENEKIDHSEIVNVTNGFSATVFSQTPGQFTTDYVALAPGQNRFHIVHFFKSGQHEDREYVIDRTPSSTQL